ncbi:FAD-dependent oxidoreductase [Aliidongia dinghuensis]|uniref:FAD-dependent oxidoreductase n=2 Tax=Aliidongia dinghuensis TaxID=1867774 RepID=A0A8J2Z1Y5_9PROT|nr:FAD-dependent oxidoreductase [Aliidongia dinghuensis]
MPATRALTALPNVPLWYEDAERGKALDSDVDADVAIVGAGYTGLWTAYYLLKAAPALRVVLIERDYAGYGASGRNGGWASAIFPVSLLHVARSSSHAAALALQAAMNATVDEIGRVLRDEGIDANYAKQGFLSLARSPAQLSRAHAAVRASAALGLPDQWRFLDARDASARVGAEGVVGGLYTEHCALVHPGRLVRGLARIVEALGARIYERTPATSFNSGSVITPRGKVRAPIIVRATEGFTPQFKEHRRTVIPLYSLVLATEPLPQHVRTELNLDHRIAFNDMRHLRVYAQVTADGRLVFGGRGAPYHFGSKVSVAYDIVDAVHEKIRATMTEFFPALSGVRVTHRWGGALGVPRDWHPSVGLDRVSGLAWAGQYVGDGVATSNLAGRILRNLILERDEEINRLPIVNHRSPQWAPEPFRWLGVNLGLCAATIGDAEERLAKRPSRVAHVLESLTGAH